MSNMSYCRFENTQHDLKDCENHLFDTDLSKTELRARQELIDLCRSIVDQVNQDEGTDDE